MQGEKRMTTRRDFLKRRQRGRYRLLQLRDAGGGRSRRRQPQRLPVMVNGKRIKTIDVHAHCHFHESLALMGDEASRVRPKPKARRSISLPSRSGSREWTPWRSTWRCCRSIRSGIARIAISPPRSSRCRTRSSPNCAPRSPDRFAAFASLSLQYPDLAVQQLETAVKKQGLSGAAIGGSVLGEDFSDPKFHPVWAKAEELGAVLFIHPQSTPELAARFKGNGWLANTIGNPLDTTIALQHLIFEGTLDSFPGLKIIAAHGGGYLPSYAPRSDHACFVSPQNCNPDIKLKKKPTRISEPAVLRCARVYPRGTAPSRRSGRRQPDRARHRSSDPVGGTPRRSRFRDTTLSDEEKAAILGGNAARLFGMAG